MRSSERVAMALDPAVASCDENNARAFYLRNNSLDGAVGGAKLEPGDRTRSGLRQCVRSQTPA